MKQLVAMSLLTLPLIACQPRSKPEEAKPVADLDSEKARVSYMVGLDVARDLAPIKDELDLAIVDQAIRTALAGEKPLLNEAALKTTREEFTRHLREKREAERQALAAKNHREGEAFLAANAKKPEVQTTPSGLQYQVLRTGTGAKPKADDTVRVNYIGSLLAGREFENTYAIDHPAEFPLSQVMPGLREALPLMPVGGKYRFWIPARLAYGAQGVPGTIEPNATLVFDVELLAIAGQ
ncbi:MAG TPA: FKBP-type peptidyl-prolyl cis-trans isomerase [Lysobacter sp.]|jgi:FKBP-type peptidyl-prolyl cis-trans isomerase|nr:FKBP-type peptidyl-prolyl cis-trans isomerase [Lysobacter sp.]